MADEKGLNWPLAMAPFEVLIVSGDKVGEAEGVYDSLVYDDGDGDGGWDVAIDDRARPLGWKLNDADLVGYPILIVLGNRFRKEGLVDVQCRRLGVKEFVQLDAGTGKLMERLGELRARL